MTHLYGLCICGDVCKLCVACLVCYLVKIWMYLVRPLEWLAHGYHILLVMFNYATWYLETMSLCTILEYEVAEGHFCIMLGSQKRSVFKGVANLPPQPSKTKESVALAMVVPKREQLGPDLKLNLNPSFILVTCRDNLSLSQFTEVAKLQKEFPSEGTRDCIMGMLLAKVVS